jgi:hypothetical protein
MMGTAPPRTTGKMGRRSVSDARIESKPDLRAVGSLGMERLSSFSFILRSCCGIGLRRCAPDGPDQQRGVRLSDDRTALRLSLRGVDDSFGRRYEGKRSEVPLRDHRPLTREVPSYRVIYYAEFKRDAYYSEPHVFPRIDEKNEPTALGNEATDRKSSRMGRGIIGLCNSNRE